MESLFDKIPPAAIASVAAIGFVGFAYFMLTIDRQRANSISKDDAQGGLKIVLFALCLFGIGTAAGGLQILLGSVSHPGSTLLRPLATRAALASSAFVHSLPTSNISP